MSVKVTIFNKQKKVKLPVGTKLLIRKACTATLKLEGFENTAEVDVTIVDDELVGTDNVSCAVSAVDRLPHIADTVLLVEEVNLLRFVPLSVQFPAHGFIDGADTVINCGILSFHSVRKECIVGDLLCLFFTAYSFI